MDIPPDDHARSKSNTNFGRWSDTYHTVHSKSLFIPNTPALAILPPPIGVDSVLLIFQLYLMIHAYFNCQSGTILQFSGFYGPGVQVQETVLPFF